MSNSHHDLLAGRHGYSYHSQGASGVYFKGGSAGKDYDHAVTVDKSGAWEHKTHRGKSTKGSDYDSLEKHLASVHSSQHSEQETQQFGESHYNIESKKFAGQSHYVGYGDGVWRIHKKSNGWHAVHQGNQGRKHPDGHGANLFEISQHLTRHAEAAKTTQHSEASDVRSVGSVAPPVPMLKPKASQHTEQQPSKPSSFGAGPRY